MIGVAAGDDELEWVREFFELFKTPWEPATPGTRYDVVLAAEGDTDIYDAKLLLVYGSEEREIDRRRRVTVEEIAGPTVVRWRNDSLPIYGRAATFAGPTGGGTLLAGSSVVNYRHDCGGTQIHRVGYNLFQEVRHLLTHGQAKSHAETPTLELHIEFIRQCLEESDAPYVEVPARPHRAPFICCLTHDIDFFGLRRHGFGRTLMGFTVRGTVGTLLDVVRGRRRFDDACRNWLAVLSLPLVFLGVTRDPWQPFDDYARADRNRRSTFFLIPFKGRAGVAPDGVTRAHRASPYGARDLHSEMRAISGASVEFAVHGIDAWHDSEAGTAELKELKAVTGQQRAGVRMHWLYFSDGSPRAIEEAGFAYDSSWGFNDAVGFRAGTSQAFQLSGTGLLELPLTIMDTALFYPDRMGLDKREAMRHCGRIVSDVLRFGGALVINWHDRSLAPERQWGRGYQELLSMMPDRTWFAAAGEAVDWFRWRRAIRFISDERSHSVRVESTVRGAALPTGAIVVRRSIGGKRTAEELAITEQAHTVRL